jgi:hypothetical protein
VHHRRDAPVGDLLPVWILFLFIAFKPCAVRQRDRPAVRRGLSLFIVILFALSVFATIFFCNRLLFI